MRSSSERRSPHDREAEHHDREANVHVQPALEVALHGPEHDLNEERGREHRTQPPRARCGCTRDRSRLVLPPRRREHGQRDQKGKKGRAEHRVYGCQRVARRHRLARGGQREAAGHPQTTEDPLHDDSDDSHRTEPLDPPPLVAAPQEDCEHHRREADQRAEQAVGVFVVDAPAHARERVQEHVVTERVRPVDHGQPGAFAGNQPADEELQ
jgi:hypothetical protein